MRFLSLIAAVVLTAALASGASAEPFAQLRHAYATRNAAAAAAAYAPDGEVVYRYTGTPEERHIGRAAIASSFRALFAQIDSKQTLDLNFRTIHRQGRRVSGVYRLRVGKGISYGRFDVELAPDGSFARDLSTAAPPLAFEEAAGPLMLEADEDLDRAYYGRLTGRYHLPSGCDLVVTRSVVRLFARNTCTGEWRGLVRVSGRVWTAGDKVLSDKALATYRFAPLGTGSSAAVEVTTDRETVRAVRRDAYRLEEVLFTSRDGTKLTGTLYLPIGLRLPLPATVLIHGSGPQDRDGYASIIAVMADALAASGRVVLAYDKRGSGGSDGDGARASFDALADDAAAGMELLASRPEVESAHVGLGGSSQAGWVAARVVARGNRPADVLLLGAAGTALTVAEQNLYNTQVRMRCAGVAEDDVALALDQQRAFFAFLTDPQQASALDALTTRASVRPGLSEWLFPNSRSTDRNGGQWYVTLEPAFDPLPIWGAYRGRALFLFADHDDATPSAEAIRRLSSTRAEVRMLQDAQHLGLLTTDRCKELGDLQAFSPALMRYLAEFARGEGRGP